MLQMKALNPTNTDEYQPITGTQLNSAGQITITIENQDQFLHLHNSYLLIEGDVLKADNTRYVDADLIALTNNGLLYLFSSLKLTLAGQTVEHVNYPGQATSLLGLASYSSTYYKGCGLAQHWFPDINTNAAANNTNNAAPGQKILEAPHNLIYLPVTVGIISTLSVWLMDQHGKLLDLRGDELTIHFHLRER